MEARARQPVGRGLAPEVKAERVAAYMDWIAPDGGREAIAAAPRVRAGIERADWAAEAERERAADAVRRLERAQPLERPHVDALEAIVLPNERPVVDVVHGTYDTPPPPFEHLGAPEARRAIEAALPAVGRIELPGHPSLPYGGTGFVVGADLLMTNRHVAELFTVGLGREGLAFRPGQSAAVDFKRERDRPASLLFRIVRVVMVHPYWDMALLATESLAGVPPLRLAMADPGDLAGRDVAVIGFPALDPRNDVDLQNRLFRGVFHVKRLQPGRLRERADVDSFGHTVSAVTHDSSTLGGNSGSAVLDVQTGEVVALHFAGRYLKANYAVPARELGRDRRVVEAGAAFDAPASPASPPWEAYWEAADGGAGAPLEALVEPYRADGLGQRRGYDEDFLGLPVPVPRVLDESAVSRLDDGGHLLAYEHFSVVIHRQRRLALLTAANVDASPARKTPEPGRDYSRRGLTGLRENDQEKWFTDPRIPAVHQLPDRFFTRDRGAFDKGHIVRREDVAWGDSYDELRRANGDTFHVTNCSPQVARFNRSALDGLWGRLENLILAQASHERYCLLAGPLLRDDDRTFAGTDDAGPVRVGIPRRFWKVVVARAADGLQTFAFLLEQDLSGTDLEFAVDAEWRGRMVAVADLERLVGLLAFPAELHDSDRIGTPEGEAVRAAAGLA